MSKQNTQKISKQKTFLNKITQPQAMIIVALVGLIGGIIAGSLTGWFGIRQIKISAELTQTAEAKHVTQTAVAINNSTPTPSKTSTPVSTAPATPTNPKPLTCPSIGEIIPEREYLQPNEEVRVTVLILNPDAIPVTFHWSASHGSLNPGLNSSVSQSTYTAPSIPVDDEIYVTLEALNCQVYQKLKLIRVDTINSTPDGTPISIERPVETPIPTIAISPTIQITPLPETKILTYTVGLGDTLSAIAKEYELNVGDLILFNEMINADFLDVGQNIKVPLFLTDSLPPPVVSVKTSYVVVNASASQESETIDYLSRGTSVLVVGFNNGWYYTCYEGGEGWVPSSAVRNVDIVPINFSALFGRCPQPHWNIYQK